MRDYTVGDTFDVKFTSRRFSSGAPFTLAGSPVISAYLDNNVTQLTAGLTLSVDFDGVTGLNNIRVVASVGNGYAAGSTYALVITAGTVDGVSVVGEVVGEFTLGRSAAFARLGAPVGASISVDIAAAKTAIDAIKAKTDNLSVDPADASDIAGAFATVNATLATVAGYIDTEVAAIKAKTDNLPTDPADASDIAALIATAQADLDNIQTRLPAALTGAGNMKSDALVVTGAVALPDVDGVSYAKMMETLMAVLFGVAAPSGSTVAFKKRDGTTTTVTVTYGTLDGERTASVIA